MLQTYNSIKDRLVDKVYPFARDPFGNLLCFDYRNNPQSPTVVFWDHEEEEMEESIYPVCSSVTFFSLTLIHVMLFIIINRPIFSSNFISTCMTSIVMYLIIYKLHSTRFLIMKDLKLILLNYHK
ncbi:SMI1 / KNR4 family [Streptococcus pneumoniae]|nr:SMI1 / KNR4 family [Streptococcus pneumoniae]